MHLLSGEEQRACLECVARHLKPEGRFVHDLFDPNLEYIVQRVQAGPGWMLDHESVDLANGRHPAALPPGETRAGGADLRQLWFKYEEYDEQGQLQCTVWTAPTCAGSTARRRQYLLELCGLRVEAAYGGFDKSPLDERCRELMLRLPVARASPSS